MAYTLKIFSKHGVFIKEIKFKDPTYIIGLFFDPKLQSENKFKYSYSSLATPRIIYECDLNSNKQKVIKQQNIKGYNKEDYKMELIWATATDGAKIPISLIYNKKQVKLNGKSALYLTTYGSYGAPSKTSFAMDRLSLLDRGVIYAIAHVRGGGELGNNWHEQAMQLKKMNTFNDFIACTEYLIEKKYTSKGKIVAVGGSAGGLIMGVIANTRPELYNSVLLLSPFLDLLGSLTDSTAKFSSLDHAEFGNPSNTEILNYVKSYSPYQNIKVQNYPNLLFYIGLNDDRVEYWQSLKSVAKLRALKTDNNKLYVKTELYAGHNGYFGTEAYCDFDAYIYAFILNNLGINY
jgi:oligopeptidase B